MEKHIGFLSNDVKAKARLRKFYIELKKKVGINESCEFDKQKSNTIQSETKEQQEQFDLELLKRRNWSLSYVFTFPIENMDKEMDEKLKDPDYQWNQNHKAQKKVLNRVQKLIINLIFQKMRTLNL
jgi:hypothetical protein